MRSTRLVFKKCSWELGQLVRVGNSRRRTQRFPPKITQPPDLARPQDDSPTLSHSQVVRFNLHSVAVGAHRQLHARIRFALLYSPETVPDGPSQPLLDRPVPIASLMYKERDVRPASDGVVCHRDAGRIAEPGKRRENYHTVTYELAERGGRTILTLKQDNNASQEEADTMAEKNWGPVLEGLKAVAEQRS